MEYLIRKSLGYKNINMILLVNISIMLGNLTIMNKALLLSLSIFTLTTVEYYYIFPLVFAQLIPGDLQQPNNDNVTSRSRSTTTHTSYAIENSNELLSLKLPMIKKAVISQIYDATGIAQKGSNDTSARVNALIINEIDNSTSKASSLGTTKSLTGTQIANAIEKLITSNNKNGLDLELKKIVVENEAKCFSSSSLISPVDCNLKIRIHQ
jgi:hypothetical protein